MKSGIDIGKFQSAMARLDEIITNYNDLIQKFGGDQSLIDDISTLHEKSKHSVFHILVMGCFKSGKSTLINTLLGEKVLPARALPTTALPIELCYGKQKQAFIYPHPGMWQGGDDPFEIPVCDIEKYCSFKISGKEKEDNIIEKKPFKKMVIYLPIQLLKDGIVLIDTPGLNNPYEYNDLSKEYILKADAIIYCFKGNYAYSSTDKKALEHLNAFGINSPIMVTTFFDIIYKNCTPDEIQEYIQINNKFAMNYTNLGEEGCHYVNSFEGLEGKKLGMRDKVVNSGYYKLEQFLSSYLAENIGRGRIDFITNRIKNLNNHLEEKIEILLRGMDGIDLDVAHVRSEFGIE